MNYSNYDAARAQIENFGLNLENNPLVFNQRVRVKVEGRKGQQGWYHLYDDLLIDDKTTGGKIILITGSYGYFQGGEKYSAKIIFDKDDLPKLSAEERKEQTRRHNEADRRAKNELATQHQKAALRAQWVWHHCKRHGEAEYIARKLIKPLEIRYSPADWHDAAKELPADLFPAAALRSRELSIPPTNSIAIPLQDETGYIWGLQFILDRATHKEKIKKRDGKDKELWPKGMAMQGKFHQIGPMITNLALVTEGYATAVSLHMATGLPVIVAFSTINIKNVLEILLPYHKTAKFLICADDDDLHSCRNCQEKIILSRCHEGICSHCHQPHRHTNDGVKYAAAACFDARIQYIRPKFPDQDERFAHFLKNKGKLTDFNDLHVIASLSVLRKQLEKALEGLGWAGYVAARVQQSGGGGEGYQESLEIKTVAEALDNIWLIYGTSLVFDERHKMIYSLKAFFDSCASSDITKQWRESKYRKKVMLEDIGFDPAGTDHNIVCNLWDYWPTTPHEGDCDLILDLLLYLCSGEGNATELAAWLIKFFAYPIQNPGAKMQTAVILYGPQGTGKNLLGDAIKGIYGKYGGTINQRALETQFNEFLSKKLFIIANEIASSSEKYEMKNALKTFITDTEIWINPKGVAAYFEQNHVNIVFFSNERMPVVLEQDDRRHCVIWTPPPRPDDYYVKVAHQIKNGGIAALHHYFLSIDLGDFNEHSKPPMTLAKQELIDLGKRPVLRFYDEWKNGDLDGIPFTPIMLDDLFDLYKCWCRKKAYKSGGDAPVIDYLSSLPGAFRVTKQWVRLGPKKRLQKTFLHLPGSIEMSIGANKEEFYTTITEQFRANFNDYKGGQDEQI